AGAVPSGDGRAHARPVRDHRRIPTGHDRRAVPSPRPPSRRRLRHRQADGSELGGVPAQALVHQRGPGPDPPPGRGHRDRGTADRRGSPAAVPPPPPPRGPRAAGEHARGRPPGRPVPPPPPETPPPPPRRAPP